MPSVVWEGEENITAVEQQGAEWRVAEKYLAGKIPGAQLTPKNSQKIELIDDKTGRRIYLTHCYLVGAEGEVFVKSNGEILGEGSSGRVIFGQTINGQMWAIKESFEIDSDSQEGKVACDLGKAKKTFKDNSSKYYQVYQFLGISLDQYLAQNTLTKEQQYDLAIKVTQAVYHLHTGTYSKEKTSYAHLDLKPENFCIDEKGTVHLIDYGFSEPLRGELKIAKGTLGYTPVVLCGVSKEQIDVIALLRTLYLPRCFKTYKADDSRCLDNDQWIFSDITLLENENLKSLLDTKNGEIKGISALEIICKLILFRYDLFSEINLQKILIYPERFEQAYQWLVALGLNQAKYVQHVLTDPKRFERAYQWLAALGLNQTEYVQQALESLETFDLNYKRLKALGLSQMAYVQPLRAMEC
ncbi:Protein kinase domain protein [Piscirickettsia salmonis]|uniref:Protein kinase domain protein n=1 Tax=Piscirickettsia salmonis TaxID=1238 RepID=A0A9Q6LN14_PISSA|nr:serine/threonine-protein kinase [Piscirickettsia salmonis]ALA26015.1 kinase domain protein [Piscirickettsia salmonis]QGN96091.1 Protein kinase domain protein [Piscirickettsia salmonis]QGO07034.1 Protein kinase domain protein [Piscirickettsia salmonis]QGO35361.1 Protein kinase domain protein [Piscirickettsia salmonis]QGO38979.1 Protein kinase domain protein [Piscirickettsia salmonis]